MKLWTTLPDKQASVQQYSQFDFHRRPEQARHTQGTEPHPLPIGYAGPPKQEGLVPETAGYPFIPKRILADPLNATTFVPSHG